SSTLACGRIDRISKIEIIGRNRRNRKNKVRNSPMGPMYVAQSQMVGRYRPQAAGRKSRWRVGTTTGERSSDMPELATMEMKKRTPTFDRTRRNQSAWGTTTLHRINDHQSGAYGPVMRFQLMYIS